MKKILFTLLLLLCTTMGWAQTPVGTLGELKEALKDRYAQIQLTADIDISSLDVDAPLCATFGGTIDGSYTERIGDSIIYCSHKIYAGTTEYETVEKDGKVTQKFKYRNFTTWSCPPLFGTLDGAIIKNVAFCNMYVEDNDHSEVGIIAHRAIGNTFFSNVSMEYCSVYCKKDRGGVMLGYAVNSTFQVVSLNRCDVEVWGVEGGGLVGHSNNCLYEMCFTSFDTYVFVDGENDKAVGWSGGFVGYSVHDTFRGGVNGALVCADESQVGGYAGESINSTFTDCINAGTVAHIDYYDLENVRPKRRKAVDDYEISPEMFGRIVGGSERAAKGQSTVIGMMVSKSESVNLQRELVTHYMQLTSEQMKPMAMESCFALVDAAAEFAEFLPFCNGATVLIAEIVIGVQVAIAIYEGDDETGGICGLARGGEFERCQNYGPLTCRDDNCGGIVGLGKGVTINNCFNGAKKFKYDEVDTTGCILGAAEANPDDGNKKCKVTNCLSTYAFHVVGDYLYHEGMDPASGNNYRLPSTYNQTIEPVPCEMIVTEDQIMSGIVSWWLNQGIENRDSDNRPWRHNFVDSIADYNVFDPSKPDVKIEDLKPFTIDSADKLIAYSQEVEKNQFLCGILTADISMTDREWTPIGKDEPNKHFRGIFDGCGHKIIGLTSSSPDKAVGLFGTVHAGAEIRNVTIGEGSSFSCEGNAGAGGIVGEVKIGWTWGNVYIENCGSHANINVNRHGGGILGHVDVPDNNTNIRVVVNNCYSMGTITTEDSNSGLLCGYTKNNAEVRRCWSGGQLRNGQNNDIRPYSSNNTEKEGEFLVGYEKDLDINFCYIVNPGANIDKYDECPDLPYTVTAIGEEEVTSGELTYWLNDNTQNEYRTYVWEQNLGTDAHPVFGSKALYHTREMLGKDYGTICVPFPLESNPDLGSVNREYYIFKEAKEEADGTVSLCFEYVDLLPAGTPALFRARYNETYEFNCAREDETMMFKAHATKGNDWTFIGTYGQKVFEGEAADTVYYVDGTAHASAIKNAKKTTIAPFRAYFGGPNINVLTNRGVSKAKMRITKNGIEDETTALELIGDDLVPVQQGGKTYSLMGTEVGEDYRGLVIRNGKKVIQNR